MKSLPVNHPRLLLAEAVALSVVAASALWLLPPAQACRATAALAVAYAIPRRLLVAAPWSGVACRWTLLGAALWLAAVALPFLHRCTVGSGASFAMPYLYGDADSYYKWALSHYDGSAIEPTITFPGYSAIIIGLWHLLGVNVIWPVAANVTVTLTVVALTGHLAARLDGQTHRVPPLAMAMIAVQGFFMSQGAQMLKEPWVYLGVTLAAMGLVPTSTAAGKTRRADDLFCFTAGCLVLALVRAKYVNFMFVAVLLMALAGQLRQWRHYAALLAAALGSWALGMALADNYTVAQQVNNVTGDAGMAAIFTPQGIYQRILGDYFHYSLWNKLLRLPLTFGVQWLIPFPWLPAGHETGWLSMAPRLRMGWYVLSGCVIYGLCADSWRHGWRFAAWAWFPILCLAGIAYMTAGTVSRYILPFQPWLMALAAMAVAKHWRTRRFCVFMTCYVAAIAALLLACRMLTL